MLPYYNKPLNINLCHSLLPNNNMRADCNNHNKPPCNNDKLRCNNKLHSSSKIKFQCNSHRCHYNNNHNKFHNSKIKSQQQPLLPYLCPPLREQQPFVPIPITEPFPGSVT